MEGMSSPNDKLIAVFEGEEIVYVTPPEYVVRYLGGFCLKLTGEDDG